jgi:mono/diheme cytochrome c family protein
MLLTVAFVAKESEEEGHATATETQVTETEPAPDPAPTAETTTEGTTTEADTGAAAGGSTAQGKEIFIANCGGCHTLDDAGTTGSVGPNLDASSPSHDKIVGA